MIIDKIHIENFGKLSNLDITLKDGLNEICEENGFGKTTLSIFLKAMFYGMPPARENIKMERKRYLPWQEGKFGGYIEFTTNQGQFRLTRFFAKTPEGDSCEILNLKTNTLVDFAEIGESLLGVGKETFEATTFFPQNNFISSANNEISANILGLDKIKYDLANVNCAIDKIKKKEGEMKRLKPSKDEIAQKKSNLTFYQNQLNQIQNSLDLSRKNLESLKLNFDKKSQEFKILEKQYSLQEQLYQTKQKLEQELLGLSSKLNNLVIEREKLQDEINLKKKDLNKKKDKYIVLPVGGIALLATVLLMVFQVVTIVIGCVVCGLDLALTALLYFYLSKRATKIDNALPDNRIGDLDKEILLVRNNILQTQSSLESYNNITEFKDDYFNAKENIAELKFQVERAKLSQEGYKKDIDSLIERVESLKEEINDIKTNEKEIENKLFVLAKTKELLLQAQKNISTRFVEPSNIAMSKILEKFELGDRKFIVDMNFDIKQLTECGVKEFDYSSQGIKDILSFSLRLYFITEIYKNEKPFVVLDDTFVNLDDKNFEMAKSIVNEFSQKYQIIYLYCNSKRAIKKS